MGILIFFTWPTTLAAFGLLFKLILKNVSIIHCRSEQRGRALIFFIVKTRYKFMKLPDL